MAAVMRPPPISIRIPDHHSAQDNRGIGRWSSFSLQSPTSSSPELDRRPSDPISIPNDLMTRSPPAISPVPFTSAAVCPNCGLRRKLSQVDIVEIGGCSPFQQSMYSTARMPRQISGQHWSVSECCGEWCPDTIRPSMDYKAEDMVGLPPGRMLKGSKSRHHRRRRSSLCYAESFTDDEEDIKVRCDKDVVVDKKVVLKVAEGIAQKVVQRSRKPSQDLSYFARTHD